ncbi:hypothetical protein G9A89_022017 [Geosiphon pyriformis]|nr:hypothetical protein G9A89_022017 [Geosiphon pyriformis]
MIHARYCQSRYPDAWEKASHKVLRKFYLSFRKPTLLLVFTTPSICITPLFTKDIGTIFHTRTLTTSLPLLGLKLPYKPLPGHTKIPDDPYLMSDKVQKLAKQGKLDEAITFVMGAPKYAVSEVVWNHLISETVELGKVKMGFRLFSEMRRRGFAPNERTYTVLLNGIAEKRSFANNVAYAINVIEKMRNDSRDTTIKPNVIHGNALLKVCSRNNDFPSLKENYEQLFGSGELFANKDTYTIMLGSCARNGAEGFEVAGKLWEEVNRRVELERTNKVQGYKVNERARGELELDDKLTTAMLLCCKNFGDTEMGFQIIKQVYGFQIDDTQVVSASSRYDIGMTTKSLDVCLGIFFKGKAFSQGISFFSQVVSKFPNLQVDIFNLNTLIALHIEKHDLEGAVNVLNEIRSRSLSPNLATYDLLLTAIKISNNWISATKVFEEMICGDVKPDSHILNLMLELAINQKKASIKPLCWLLERIESLGLNATAVKNKKKLTIQLNEFLLRNMISAYDAVFEKASQGLLTDKKEIWRFMRNQYQYMLNELLENSEVELKEKQVNTKQQKKVEKKEVAQERGQRQMDREREGKKSTEHEFSNQPSESIKRKEKSWKIPRVEDLDKSQTEAWAKPNSDIRNSQYKLGSEERGRYSSNNQWDDGISRKNSREQGGIYRDAESKLGKIYRKDFGGNYEQNIWQGSRIEEKFVRRSDQSEAMKQNSLEMEARVRPSYHKVKSNSINRENKYKSGFEDENNLRHSGRVNSPSKFYNEDRDRSNHSQKWDYSPSKTHKEREISNRNEGTISGLTKIKEMYSIREKKQWQVSGFGQNPNSGEGFKAKTDARSSFRPRDRPNSSFVEGKPGSRSRWDERGSSKI